MTEERFSFTASAKKTLMIVGVIGIVLLVVGTISSMSGGHAEEGEHAINTITSQTDLTASLEEGPEHAAEEAHGGGHHGSAPWLKRLFTNLWINNIYFTGLAIIGLFFVAIQYATQAGWSAGMKRIPLAMAHWLPIAGVLMLVSWFVVNHDVFHWTSADLYLPVAEGGDKIIDRKSVV
ncbi:MAG: quinol:cytochrome C oxidoreductase, partial [Fulvivirga sp.]